MQGAPPSVVDMLLPRVDRWVRNWSIAHPIARWSNGSQLGSRRNAMVAATALAQRRIERQDVEAFLASREALDERAAPRESEVSAAAR